MLFLFVHKIQIRTFVIKKKKQVKGYKINLMGNITSNYNMIQLHFNHHLAPFTQVKKSFETI